MAYTPTKWENSPSTNTPVNADNLNKLEQGVKDLHDALDSGELKGPKGEKGDTGSPGTAGAKGGKGDKGDPGVTPDELASIIARLDALEAK